MPERTMISEVREHYVMLVESQMGTADFARQNFAAAMAEAWEQGVDAERAVECNCRPGAVHMCGPVNPYRAVDRG